MKPDAGRPALDGSWGNRGGRLYEEPAIQEWRGVEPLKIEPLFPVCFGEKFRRQASQDGARIRDVWESNSGGKAARENIF
jgi:hypothetical protein